LQPSKLAKRGWILLFLAIAVFYLYGLGAFPFVGPDEPRYAEVAREMLARRDLITPTLGGVPWFEKPALLYWLIMAGYRVFGVSEYSARLGAALCPLLAAFGIFAIARRVTSSGSKTETASESPDNFASWSALVFLSSAGAIVFSRAVSFDIVLTMTVTVALACFFLWQVAPGAEAGKESVAVAGGFYVFVGLSLLAKGLVGVIIPFGVIGLYLLLRREWPARGFRRSLWWGLPLSLAVAAIWYGPMYARHGWTFIDQFIIQHHFARFATNKYHHPQAFYFYLTILPLLVLPWTIFLGAAFIGARRWHWWGDTPRDRMRVFALAWIVLPVALFSISRSKLPAYILPVLPGLALLTADRLAKFIKNDGYRTAMRLTGALVLLGAIAAGVFVTQKMGVGSTCAVLLAMPVVAAGAIALSRPQLAKPAVMALALATFVAAGVAITCISPVVGRTDSVRALFEVAAARGYGKTPVVQLHMVERTAEFYAAGSLIYGRDGEPVRVDDITPIVDIARRENGPVLVLVPAEYEWKLHVAMFHLQAEQIASNGHVALSVVRIAP